MNDKEEFITHQLSKLSENNAILTTQEVREVGSTSGVKRLNGDTLDDINEKLKGLEIQRTWFEGKVQGKTDPKRTTIFRVTKQLIEIKIDKLCLKTNKAPLYEEVREVLEETAKTSEWMRFQRFWRWLKKNAFGTGGVAVTVVGVIFSIVYDLKSSAGSGIREVKRSLKQAQKKLDQVWERLRKSAGHASEAISGAIGKVGETVKGAAETGRDWAKRAWGWLAAGSVYLVYVARVAISGLLLLVEVGGFLARNVWLLFLILFYLFYKMFGDVYSKLRKKSAK